MIDQSSAEGKALQATVKLELRNYLGKDYNDDVLPLYIVVMLAHGNQQSLVAENLEAFLGQEKATVFADWLFRHLGENPGKYDAPTLPLEPVQPEPAAAAAAGDAEPAPQVDRADESGHKRRRDKREKIEWKVEQAKDSRHAHRDREAGGREHREEKRRKGSEQERERADRLPDGHHRERERERERPPFDRREPEDSRARHAEPGRESRHRLSDRASDRDRRSERHERPRHRDYDRESEDHARHADAWDDRRDGRSTRDRHKEAAIKEPERQLRVSSRLAGRLGEPNAAPRAVPRSRSRSPPPAREEARPSVFDRLNRLPAEQQEPPPRSRADQLETKSKMRMDAVATPAANAADPEPQPATATPLQPSVSLGAPDEVASELRQIRETLAKMQAEKVRQVDKVIASANARKAVVHNVHFNAPPEIVKAHFSGCGNIVSAIIEKDPSGNPRGVAVVEFEEESSRKTALTLSGSMLLGRPVTVYPKETAPQYAPPVFKARAPAPRSFRPRAPMAGRGRAPGRLPGRGSMPGRTMLKNNKYVRPQAAADEAKAANGSAAPAAVRS